jgi:hypothetical protein
MADNKDRNGVRKAIEKSLEDSNSKDLQWGAEHLGLGLGGLAGGMALGGVAAKYLGKGIKKVRGYAPRDENMIMLPIGGMAGGATAGTTIAEHRARERSKKRRK